jgi:stage II sporulation protein D
MHVEQRMKQLLLAVVMGLAMPAMALRLGPMPQEETLPTVQTSQEAETALTVPVLTSDGAVQIQLETYVLGVVLAEMPASFETEALKAQAVAARTVAMRSTLVAQRHTGGALCTDPDCCQAYMPEAEYLAQGGDRANLEKGRSAVNGTREEVLTYNGELIEAVYFSCSGGLTEDAAVVWGNDIPYLQSVESGGEEEAEHYWAGKTFTAAQFAAALGQSLPGSPGSWFGAVTYTPGGGVNTMVIGGQQYSGIRLRQLLDLNSTIFSVEVSGDTITVFTRGKGHRVGMSQYGADAMAVRGSGYAAILAHYYRGTRIDKIPSLG